MNDEKNDSDKEYRLPKKQVSIEDEELLLTRN
jgi:hypothetical protein